MSTVNLARLARMRPDELRTRAQQAVSKRWAKPPACRLIDTSASPSLPDLPPIPSRAGAEQLLRHRFDLLGYRDLDFGTPIDWHFDPVHQERAPRAPWYKIPFLDFDQVGDHKIIWELNRHQHLVTLAQAWQLTKDERFRNEILSQWTHWQHENTYPTGINWASTLEVAFRVLSWLWVRHLLGDFHPDLIPALHLHGWHIERYLSTYFSPNTHLLGEGVALFAIAVMCPQIADAHRWQAQGWQIILEQAETQVRSDGFHFEQSVYYHIYARDFFEFTRALAAKNSLPVPPSFEDTIAKMNEALAALSQAGRPPNFGDDDGGRLIGSPAFSASPRPRVPASLGPRVPGSPARPLVPSPAQPVGGIYSMTGPRTQLFIDAGPQGAFTAGHGHADALSIQLIADGLPVLIDPGTFCYVCPERDRYRGTAAHNTLQLDGRDQAQPAGPFAWTNLPETIVDRWYSSDDLDFFAGHHNGYHPVIHRRWVIGVKPRFWLVRDAVSEPRPSGGNHRIDIHWHFLDERDLTILPPAGHAWTHSTERWDWSPVYGRKELAYVLRFSQTTALPAEFAVLLVRSNPGVLTQNAPGSYLYKEPQTTHEFVFTGDDFLYRVATADGVREHRL